MCEFREKSNIASHSNLLFALRDASDLTIVTEEKERERVKGLRTLN